MTTTGTTTTEFLAFPIAKIPAARAALDRAHSRLVRAARRAGQECPEAPTLAVTREYVVSVCTSCKATTDGFAGGRCMSCVRSGREGFITSRKVADVEIQCARPRLAGWEFLAVIEPLPVAVTIEGASAPIANLLRAVPGATIAEGELAHYRSADASTCDHCRARRHRSETFVVRADGTDAAIPAGTMRQVGRNCLAAFLGGKSPAAILAALAYPRIIGEMLGDGEGGGHGGDPVWPHEEFLAWTAASVRLTGWCSRQTSRDSGGMKQATADHVIYLLTPPCSYVAGIKWDKARTEFRPTDEDHARAAAALEYARALAGSSDYEISLKTVAHQPHVDGKHAGLMASAIAAYGRHMGDLARRAARPTSEHVGTVGEKIEATATIERVITIDTAYGPLHIHTFRTDAGAVLVWRTGRVQGAPGDRVDIRGTVKEHGEYKGDKQTELTRCKVAAPGELAPAPKSRRRKAPSSVASA